MTTFSTSTSGTIKFSNIQNAHFGPSAILDAAVISLQTDGLSGREITIDAGAQFNIGGAHYTNTTEAHLKYFNASSKNGVAIITTIDINGNGSVLTVSNSETSHNAHKQTFIVPATPCTTESSHATSTVKLYTDTADFDISFTTTQSEIPLQFKVVTDSCASFTASVTSTDGRCGAIKFLQDTHINGVTFTSDVRKVDNFCAANPAENTTIGTNASNCIGVMNTTNMRFGDVSIGMTTQDGQVFSINAPTQRADITVTHKDPSDPTPATIKLSKESVVASTTFTEDATIVNLTTTSGQVLMLQTPAYGQCIVLGNNYPADLLSLAGLDHNTIECHF